MTKVPIRWRCPICGRKHEWRWWAAEIHAGLISMECSKCKTEVPCWIDKDGNVEVVG